MWTEDGDELTRISQGNGNGNADDCHPAWTNDCDVDPGHAGTARSDLQQRDQRPGHRRRVRRGKRRLYFYSPEVLDGGKPAVADERNLYVFRDGEPQFVATFDPGTEINRMQISPTASFAAWSPARG